MSGIDEIQDLKCECFEQNKRKYPSTSYWLVYAKNHKFIAFLNTDSYAKTRSSWSSVKKINCKRADNWINVGGFIDAIGYIICRSCNKYLYRNDLEFQQRVIPFIYKNWIDKDYSL